MCVCVTVCVTVCVCEHFILGSQLVGYSLHFRYFLFWRKIQTHKRFKQMLFIRTKTQSANFQGDLFYQATK